MGINSRKVLIVVPPLYILGGVALHYAGLKNYWEGNVEYYQSFKIVRGANRMFAKVWLLLDIINFFFIILFKNPDVVVFNLSLKKGFYSRILYQRVVKILGKKMVIFIHGWNVDSENMLLTAKGKWMMRQADGIIVLAQQFKDKLLKYGINKKILLTTTKVDDALVGDFNVVSDRDYSGKNILFVSRIEKEKGIYEVVNTYALLKPKYKDLKLTFVGDGTELGALKECVAEKGLQDVRFTGRLDGMELAKEYKAANFFFFPSYGEGLPTVVLEAMAFGLPVFSRKVGGLVDFFENDKMGYITDSLNPKDFVDAIEPYIKDENLTRTVSLYNEQYAKVHFMASTVAKFLESYFKTI